MIIIPDKEKENPMNSTRTIYYKCNMSKTAHLIAYLAASILLTGIVWLFYHWLPISIIVGFVGGVFLERFYAQSTVEKQQRELRLQFKDFLASMSVAVGAGNVEAQAVRSALKDLKIAYNEKAAIVREVEWIVLQYEKGGRELKDLFVEFAQRSGVEDIQSFATIYAVIEGKSDRFGDILLQTQEIIGDKIAIEQEIQTTITSAKSETNTMLIMPVVIVIAMSMMGGGLLDKLFTSVVGHVAATVALVIFVLSYVIAVKVSRIEV